jgi:hypothetical protein
VVRLPFAQDLITAVSMPKVNQLLGRLLTMDSFLALVPDPTHVNALDLVAETNNVFMQALYDYWAAYLSARSQGLLEVTIEQLTKETNDLWGPVMIAWAKKWDPVIADMGTNVTAKQVIQKSAIAKVVAQELGRSLGVMIEMFIWWHREHVAKIDEESEQLSRSRFDAWLQEQVDPWMPRK